MKMVRLSGAVGRASSKTVTLTVDYHAAPLMVGAVLGAIIRTVTALRAWTSVIYHQRRYALLLLLLMEDGQTGARSANVLRHAAVALKHVVEHATIQPHQAAEVTVKEMQLRRYHAMQTHAQLSLTEDGQIGAPLASVPRHVAEALKHGVELATIQPHQAVEVPVVEMPLRRYHVIRTNAQPQRLTVMPLELRVCRLLLAISAATLDQSWKETGWLNCCTQTASWDRAAIPLTCRRQSVSASKSHRQGATKPSELLPMVNATEFSSFQPLMALLRGIVEMCVRVCRF